jgi:hypothetical protein
MEIGRGDDIEMVFTSVCAHNGYATADDVQQYCKIVIARLLHMRGIELARVGAEDDCADGFETPS